MTRWSAFSVLFLLLAAGCHGNLAGIPNGSTPASDVKLGPHAIERLAIRSASRVMPLKVGSANTVTADMPVPRPDTTPCTVTLFKNVAFTDFSNRTYPYTPPKGSACKGPWAKVVLNVDIRVSKGVQYDRTGIIWLDGAVIYFGTTAEPSPTLQPHWHVERDVTDLSALFTRASTGQIQLWNCYCPNSGFNGIPYGKATVQFYPPDAKYPAPRVPDEVIGIPYSPPFGNVATLPQNAMQIQTTLPRNITSAWMDLYLQSQNKEEQWFMCAPTGVWNASNHVLGFCQNSAFREGEVRIDGTPAGTAAIYPWIYTGGMNPWLWYPIPGVQTLEFVPEKVDLTPFAAELSNGSQHTISVSVYKAYSYFSGAGDLLLYRDPKAMTVSGAVTANTLQALPLRRIHTGITYGSGSGLFGYSPASGPVDLEAWRDYTIDGYVVGSAGKVDTKLSERSSFTNRQSFQYTSSLYQQLVVQDTMRHAVTTTTSPSGTTVTTWDAEYPLSVGYANEKTKSGLAVPVTVYQGYHARLRVRGAAPSFSDTTDTVQSASTFYLNGSYSVTAVKGSASTQLYTYKDSTGICYGKELASKKNVLTGESKPGCTAKPPPQPSPKP